MIEAMKEALNVLDQLPFDLGRSILMIITLSLVLRATLNLAQALCRGERIVEIPSRSEPKRSEPIRAEPAKVNLKKDTFDNDLKKYFDYDVKR